MARTAWVFTDPVTSATYNWEINPYEGGTPGIRKNILTKSTAASDGQAILQEGRDDVQELTVTGHLLSEELLAAMKTWANKRYPVLLTDDLGRQFRIYITAVEFDRERSVNRVWRHLNKVTYLVLAEI